MVKHQLSRKSPLAEIIAIFHKYYSQGLQDLDLQLPHKEIEDIIKTNLKDRQNKRIIKQLHKQCKKTINFWYRPFTTTQFTPGGAIAETIKTYGTIQTYYDNTYIPTIPYDHKRDIYEILTHCDHNPKWQDYNKCQHCTTQHQYPKIHLLLNCRNYQQERTLIFDSIITEITHYLNKYNAQQIIQNEPYQILLDAAEDGLVHPADYDKIMELLLGNHISHELNTNQKSNIKRMLLSHLILLINTIKHQIPPITNTIQIANSPYEIAQDDIQRGKIVTRTITNTGDIQYRNIRNLIETLTIPELQAYNIGLGSAHNRTHKQKILAQQYTNNVIENAHDTIIVVDGSINTKDNPMSQSKQKQTRTGYGGYGGITINKNTQQTITTFKGLVNTNDSQLAELHGIHAALQQTIEIYHNMNVNNFTILCDCKNATKYVNNEYTTPPKYADICHKIKELRKEVQQKYRMDIKWIPGHTNNKWNDEADRLAKEATKLHLPGNRSHNGRALSSNPLQWDAD